VSDDVRLTPEQADEIRRKANAEMEQGDPQATPYSPLYPFMLRVLADLTFSPESGVFIRIEGTTLVETSKWSIEDATPLSPPFDISSTND
jgi:hypothetical protein